MMGAEWAAGVDSNDWKFAAHYFQSSLERRAARGGEGRNLKKTQETQGGLQITQMGRLGRGCAFFNLRTSATSADHELGER